MKTTLDHTFVVCAYLDNPYLVNCIESLLNQTVKSQIIIETSTPSEYLSDISNKYNIPIVINENGSQIGRDWNYGLSKVTTKWATIAHQDDIYSEDYVERLLAKTEKSSQPLIYFTDYGEIRNDELVENTTLLNIKRKMLFPLKYRIFHSSIFVRRRILSMGSAISCPTVSYYLPNLKQPIFDEKHKVSLDWAAWEKISKYKGQFIYDDKVLMYHRIHEESQTTENIVNNVRSEEDFEMFCRFWPRWIAKIIHHFYSKSENSNNL